MSLNQKDYIDEKFATLTNTLAYCNEEEITIAKINIVQFPVICGFFTNSIHCKTFCRRNYLPQYIKLTEQHV
jgi:hypothetical protein